MTIPTRLGADFASRKRMLSGYRLRPGRLRAVTTTMKDENISIEVSAARLAKVRNLGLIPEWVVQTAFDTYVDSMLQDEILLCQTVLDSAEWRQRKTALVA